MVLNLIWLAIFSSYSVAMVVCAQREGRDTLDNSLMSTLLSQMFSYAIMFDLVPYQIHIWLADSLPQKGDMAYLLTLWSISIIIAIAWIFIPMIVGELLADRNSQRRKLKEIEDGR